MKTLIVFLSFFLVAEVFAANPAFTGFRGDGVVLGTTNPVAGTVTYSGQPYILTNGQVSAVTFNTSLTLGAVGSADSFRLSYNAGTPSLDVFNTFSGLVQFSFLESGINQSVVDMTVPDEVYGVAWDGSLEVPTKNALFDKIQTISGATPGGNAGDVQFPEGGTFAGTNVFNYDRTNRLLRITEPLYGILLNPQGIYQGSNQPLSLGVWAGGGSVSNWQVMNSSPHLGSLAPTITDAYDIGTRSRQVRSNVVGNLYVASTMVFSNGAGAGKVLTTDANGVVTPQTPAAAAAGTNFDSIIVTNQIINGQDFISGNMVATNIDFSLGMVYANSTNTVVDPVFSATNLIPSITSLFVLGQTNGATNHTITLTNSLGAKFIHFNGTNGSFTVTLFSNSWMRFTMQVVTNATDTNIFVTTEGNSGWPQPNQLLIAAAGGSRSNIVAGGIYYVDTLPAYTNINSTIGTFTNLATNVIAGHALTNLWDMYYHRWGLKFRSGFSTNNWQVVLGSQTIFDSGVCTNNVDSGYIETRIWRTDNTNQHCETTLHLGFSSFTGGMTNRNIETTQTNGIDTVLQLRGAASRFMSFTNNSSYGMVNPRQ